VSGIEACFSGRAGSVPELKTSKSGNPWCAFSLAVSDGSDTTQATWVRVCLFGSLAEEMAEKIEKGCRVYAEGRLTLQTYTGRDGAERAGLQLAAHHVTRMAPKANKPKRAGFPPGRGYDRPAETGARPMRAACTQDDAIPF
jgi:single-strand DNA-binding protein